MIEYSTQFPGETPESIKNLLGMWYEANPKRAEEFPSVKEMNAFIKQMRFPKLISPKVEDFSGKWTRRDVATDPKSLYIFTDNTDRDSGKNPIDPASKYAKKYGQGKHYPTTTQAVIRGLDNAMPLSTQRWYHEGAKGVAGRWTDANFEEFKAVIDAEIDAIVEEWSTGKYTRIVIGEGSSFFNTSIADISEERTPKIYEYLKNKLEQIGIKNTESKASPDTVINIYAGTGENAHLSNFAVRPFTHTWKDGKQTTFQSVEQAFQFAKARMANDRETAKEILSTNKGSILKKLGRSVKGLDAASWDKSKEALMKTFIRESFVQNPLALNALLVTGNATLTHTQDTSSWGQMFPKILMEVREELRKAKREFDIKNAEIAKQQAAITKFSTSSSEYYNQRTRENAEWSDVTIALARNFDSAGEKATKNVTPKNKYVKADLVDTTDNPNALAEDIYQQLVALGKTKNLKLNIAGNGIYHLSGSQSYYNQLLTDIIRILQEKGVTISEIRSGGQTGIDEAGIIAAQRLGIPNTVHTTSDFKFRKEPGKDIKDEVAFKARFAQKTPTKVVESSAPEMLDDALMAGTISSPEVDAEDEIDTDNMANLPIATLAEQKSVDLEFDPRTRRDRVTLISRLFSNEVDVALKEKQDELNIRMMMKNLTKSQRDDLRKELANLDRIHIIKQLTPGGIFNRVKAIFEGYINDTDEGRVQAELDKINAKEQLLISEGIIEESERFSEEEKLEAAKKYAVDRLPKYEKMVKHFIALAEEASGELLFSEKIRVDPDGITPGEANLNEDTPEGESATDDSSKNLSNEDSVKDGWMVNFRHVSSQESLAQAVRKVIREIPKLDYEGLIEEDDLGNIRYLDPNYVHATLNDKLRNMITSEDMIPMLEDLSRVKPWVEQVMEVIQEDDVLFSQFYQDFRKDFTQYWIQKTRVNPDGTIKVETICINSPEGVYYLIDSWRDNYESGTLLDPDSVYDKSGNIIKENAALGLSIHKELNNALTNKTTEERLELLEQQEWRDKLLKLYHMIGIDPNPSILDIAIHNIKKVEGITFEDPIMLILPNFQIILKGIENGEVKDEKREDGSIKKGDLINTFGSAYNSLATILAEVTEDAIESSVRENDKSYYSHLTPSYLGKLVKQLKDVRNDPVKFEQFIQEEFRQYEWFFKDGKWRHDWIEKLVTDPDMRKALQHKVVLNKDKVAYSDWDKLDYTLVLLNEFWAEPKEKMAWYHLPIPSDAPSAEFIRFVRYTDGSEIDEEGNRLTYQQSITNKIINIIQQEYDRIMLVRKRIDKYNEDENSIKLIANYDSRGLEFCFFPELNTLKYDNDETFLKRFERLRSESPSEFRKFLESTVMDIMENGFEKAYSDWVDMGLLEELPNGKYKHLSKPYQGQSAVNQRIARALDDVAIILGNDFTTEMVKVRNLINRNRPVDDRVASRVFAEIKEKLAEKARKGEIEQKRVDALSKDLTTKNNAKMDLREYYWNSTFASSQIIQMTTTDLAFYANPEDFQKRYKEVHAPALRLNTLATFRGKPIGRTWERTIYLADDEIVSSTIADIEEILDAKVASKEITSIDKDYIVSQFKKINVADAQAYRSLSSYRAMMGMQGQWTDEMETAYEHLTSKDGKWTIQDFNIIWQTKKPFCYTQINNDNGVGDPSGIKTPVQHKNSEYLLLALYDAIAGPLGKSGKLKAINDFMEKHQIDVVQFESTTKVGKQGVIDLNGVDDYKSTWIVLGEETGIARGEENPSVVHKVSYEDYGIQTATPEHAIDAVQLVGTQIRKLITADIKDDADIIIDGQKKTKAQWLQFYNEINTENIIQSFIEIDEIFKDKKEIEKILQEEIRSNARYDMDMLRACTLNETGEFNIPLYDPIQSLRVQSLLNSIIKSRVTKQKIRGGALIQVSSYGVTKDLEIVYEGEGENKRIKYLECYMPAYSREFYEPLMDENGMLNITKLPDELRRLVGYRVPTEDKYSMVPLYIKGFLPQQTGSAIMLPAEITTLSGSDFDVDKLYIMLPEFQIVSKYNVKRAWDDFYADSSNSDIVSEIDKNVGIALQDYIDKHPDDVGIDRYEYLEWLKSQGIFKYRFSETAQKRFSEWFKSRKSKYFLEQKIEKLEYDYSKPAHQQESYKGDNGRARRNNAIIDLMWGILTNPDTAHKILNPGNFDKQKMAAAVVTILDSLSEKELAKKGYTMNSLLEQAEDVNNLKKISDLAKESLSPKNPLSPRTQVIFHQQNMTGASMIGIYANHNANHALMQHTELAIDDANGSFKFAKVKRVYLNKMKNEKGEFISRNNANYLAASVDNVKENTLHATNQNSLTGDLTMLLSRLGYNPVEIAILMRQPIVMEITKKYFRESREGKSKEAVIEEILKSTIKYSGMIEELSWSNVQDNKFEIDTLAKDIMLYKDVTNMSDKDKIDFYRRQVTVGLLFQRIMKTADALGRLVQATRADTQGGAAGPSIADTMIKIQKVEDFIEASREESFPLINADVIDPDITYNGNVATLRQQLISSKLPFLQAFYTLGIKQTESLLSLYFPHYTDAFKEVIDGKYEIIDGKKHLIFEGLRKMTKLGKLDVKTMNSIYNDLLVYIMSKTEFFGKGSNKRGKEMSTRDKRDLMINHFPKYFKKIIEDNPDIAELEFIKRLKTSLANDKTPVNVIIFKNVGSLSPDLKSRYSRDWASLLYMKNPKAQELALNLVLYSYYRNGFAFGPTTFIHLAPLIIRDAIPDYISTLRDLLTKNDSYEDFIEQYVYNHLDNRKLVPEVKEGSTFKFVDEEGNFEDEVTVTIDNTSSYEDKSVVKSVTKVDGESIYEFFRFIGKKSNGKWAYYRLSEIQGDDTAIYSRIEPLGYKHNFLEYEWGVSADSIESVIANNKKGYDPLKEYTAQFTTPDLTEEDYAAMPSLDEVPDEVYSQAAFDAFEDTYGELPEFDEFEDESFTDIPTNDSYKDANDEYICG